MRRTRPKCQEAGPVVIPKPPTQDRLERLLALFQDVQRLYEGEWTRASMDELGEKIREIDVTLYPERDWLQRWDRAEGTMLRLDWRDLRENDQAFTEVALGHAKGTLTMTIDALRIAVQEYTEKFALTFNQALAERRKELEPERQQNRHAKTQHAGESESNIQGMSWQEAREQAEEYVAIRGFPGIRELARVLQCSPSAVTKAINNSEALRKAEAEHKAAPPTAEQSTARQQASTPQATEQTPAQMPNSQLEATNNEAATPQVLPAAPAGTGTPAIEQDTAPQHSDTPPQERPTGAGNGQAEAEVAPPARLGVENAAEQPDRAVQVDAQDPWRVPWNPKDPNYMQSGDARTMFTEGKLSASLLSKRVGKIPVRYMRKPGLGCRVHITEFYAWAATIYLSDAQRDKITSGYLADVDARKEAARRAKHNLP